MKAQMVKELKKNMEKCNNYILPSWQIASFLAAELDATWKDSIKTEVEIFITTFFISFRRMQMKFNQFAFCTWQIYRVINNHFKKG